MKSALPLMALCLMALGCPTSTTTTSTTSSSSSGGVTTSSGTEEASSSASHEASSTTSSSALDAGMTIPDAGMTIPDAGLPQPPVHESLRWRTAHAFEHHLMQALGLQEDEVCNELGLFKCVTRPAAERPFRPSGTPGNPTVGMPIPHQVALGGNEPFDLGNYEARKTPGVTTPNAVDRVVLSACDARVEKDRVGPAVIFTGIDLAAPSLVDGPALRGTITTLFRRFHQRAASPAEMDLVALLAAAAGAETPTAADVALAMCVAVGGMAESSFD